MIPSDKFSLFAATFDDEKVAKVFIVVGEDTRKCLVCDQLFTRQESFEHSKVTCYPWTHSC
ncbi:MAG TPA: hypothetical protein VGS27_11020 [Candidatus Sulfotelmatobacter sp.]|nr:hypothetical protein [Candidatus Sulfotelmatobacter sp.]